MTIFKNKIQIEIEKPIAGGLDLSSKETGTENGKVIAIGGDVVNQWILGKTILFKAWALDCIDYEGTKYYFISEDSEGICAII